MSGINPYFLQLAEQPELCHCPVPLHSSLRNLKGFCCFFDAEAAEESHLDDLTLSRIDRGQLFERGVEREDISAPLFSSDELFVKRDLLHPATALLIPASARRINEHSAHQP